MPGLKDDTGAIVCSWKIVNDDAEALLFAVDELRALFSIRYILDQRAGRGAIQLSGKRTPTSCAVVALTQCILTPEWAELRKRRADVSDLP